MTAGEARARLAAARVARLGTVDHGGCPHLVPVCFALAGDVAYTAVDHKPKRHARLRRVENVEATGAAALVADHYDEDWSRLWWVSVRGRGRVVGEVDERERALDLLAAKYVPYRERRPAGPVLALDIAVWRFWSAV